MTVLSDLFTINFNPLRVVISLALALVIGLYIFFIYKKSFSGVMYSRNFNVSLILITLVTTLVLMLISTNITLALGMVGALSIVRFRTAIKDPIDTAFIFWAVGEGLALGVGFFDAAIIGGVVIGIFVLLLSAFKVRSAMPYLLVLHYSEAANGPIKQMIKQLPGARIRSKTAQRDGIELTLELRLRDNETGFVEKFLRVEGVYDASLISYQGDLVS
ncbi:MAG: DUF4956 domain-containing protein [Oscillospiraceae bacterium]|nr:DUF4956 domain-containing protein [Christensenellales bacterium]PWM02587.1 MAG: DUF4956 domain-containing protein [Clostridiales bacterium]HIR68870.1 DUF4956 domain-containing protein [Candidatus Pelethousia gallinarum]